MANPKQQRKQRALGSSLEMAQYLGAGTNKIKKRIRDIERLLVKKKDILPDTVILEKERTLEALKLELNGAELNQKAKKYSSKYHMVRFFERKKALKKYNQCLRKIELIPDDEREAYNKRLLGRKIDVCYAVNFPKTQKYISLYPSMDTPESEDSKSFKQRKIIRDLIAKQLEEGKLPVSFEDILKGKTLDKNTHGVTVEDDNNQQSTGKNVKNGKSRNEENAEQEEQEQEEEDDFFE
ncbi:similar to Saccharomyces cerevisiae YGR271C-A EFG1 Essential protein required for maturation of 18S rRNA [Maudiozyma saulgeensis]|uniref:rRNA-processing protein EFG1 n=1 Tax=Maudiozyma saulgeensis TaxID=1789683 RepID=A0A1X7R9Q3_9SACH|nr:similar to Saccharomyces cerevisiae YGR271C-A EFG1 Essential protein required for maturation of 18S rRNA [Kazachstania saulgeensis]